MASVRNPSATPLLKHPERREQTNQSLVLYLRARTMQRNPPHGTRSRAQQQHKAEQNKKSKQSNSHTYGNASITNCTRAQQNNIEDCNPCRTHRPTLATGNREKHKRLPACAVGRLNVENTRKNTKRKRQLIRPPLLPERRKK